MTEHLSLGFWEKVTILVVTIDTAISLAIVPEPRVLGDQEH